MNDREKERGRIVNIQEGIFSGEGTRGCLNDNRISRMLLGGLIIEALEKYGASRYDEGYTRGQENLREMRKRHNLLRFRELATRKGDKNE